MKTKLCILLFACAALMACEKNTENTTYRWTKIAPCVLDEDVTNCLNQIFNPQNANIQTPKTENIGSSDSLPVYIIRNEDELASICPNNMDVPKVDFNTQCIVYSSIVTSSVPYKITATDLFFNEGDNHYLFYVEILKSESSWPAIGHLYPYGVFPLATLRVNRIELVIDYTEKL